MKKLLFTSVFIITAIVSFSQVPNGFNYQAVIRDNAGELISEQSVGVKLSILNESSTGTVLYSETHTISTNAYGQLTIKVGNGAVVSGVFSDIIWGSGDKYLKLELDATGGDNYTALGEVQLLSVPYALYAKNVENKDDADADPANEIQDLNLTGNTLTITNNALATPIDLAPYQGTNTDEQTLSLTGTDLSISGGNLIDVSSLQDGIDDADADTTNEIQDLNLTSNVLTITNNTTATPIDLAPYQGTNTDEQTLSLAGTDLSITGGNTIDVSSLQDADNDPANEIQVLSISNDTIYLANGGFVKLPFDNIDDADNSTTNELQTLLLDGDTLEITNGNSIVFPYDSVRWELNGDKMYYNTGNVGIGTSAPNSKLEVKADASFTENDTLFAVKDKNGNIVFAVFPDGAKVYVNDGVKGTVGGFAVSGRNPAKASIEENYFKVTPDSTRVWVNENTKGTVGGFAVSGRNPAKSTILNYFVSTADSTRIYINDTSTTKGTVGGFAVSGRNPAKGFENDYFVSTADSTRIYINEGAKGTVGGFAVSGRNPAKGITENYMEVSKDSTRIYVKEGAGKGTVGGFAVRGIDNISNKYSDYMSLGRYTSKIYSISEYESQEYTSWNLLLENMTKFTDTLKLMRAAYGNLSMTIPYGDFFCKIISSPKFEILGRNPSKGPSVKVLSVGFENTSLGTGSGISITGSNNLLFSNNSLTSEDFLCGDENIILGYGFMTSNFEGCSDISNNNILIGSELFVKGEHNVCIGSYTGGSSGFSSGSYNLFLGYKAGGSNEEGFTNIFLGRESGFLNTAGNSSVLIGNYAGYNAQGNLNICIGEKAGYWETGSHSFYIDIFGRTNLADQQAKAMFYGQFHADPASQYLQINAKLGIGGLWNSSYALYVTGNVAASGNITAASFIATMSGTGAYKYNTTSDMIVPDYVFDTYIEGKSTRNPNYEMLNLNDLRQYIIQNRHLPRVPSRAEIERDGIVNLQSFSMITLEKVEENTLYIIELEEISKEQKQVIKTQKREIDIQKTKISDLENRLIKIEKLLLTK